jgi:DNA-binding NtrC family response regulator
VREGKTRTPRKPASRTAVAGDRCLPDGDGVEFAQEIREECPDLACAIITANGSGANAEKAVEGGAVAYLAKPFSVSEIRTVLFRRYPRYLIHFVMVNLLVQ